MHDPNSPSPRDPGSSGGPGGHQPIFNAPPVTLVVVLAIVAMFILLQVLPAALQLAMTFSVVPNRFAYALSIGSPMSVMGEATTLVTHALIHTDLVHMAMNAGFLLAFGSFCERALGRDRYILLLLGSAAGGGLVQIAVDWGVPLIMYGASGAVSGCMGGMVRVMLRPGANPQRRRFALSFVAVLFAVNLIFGMIGPSLMGVSGEIAWEAHIGGFVAGFLIAGSGRRGRTITGPA